MHRHNEGGVVNPLDAQVRRMDKSPTIEKWGTGREKIKRKFEDSQWRQTIVERIPEKEYMRPDEMIKELKMEISIDPLGQSIDKEEVSGTLEADDAWAEGWDLEENINESNSDDEGDEWLMMKVASWNYPFVFLHMQEVWASEWSTFRTKKFYFAIWITEKWAWETLGMWLRDIGSPSVWNILNQLKWRGVTPIGYLAIDGTSLEQKEAQEVYPNANIVQKNYSFHDLDIKESDRIFFDDIMHKGFLVRERKELWTIMKERTEWNNSWNGLFSVVSEFLQCFSWPVCGKDTWESSWFSNNIDA